MVISVNGAKSTSAGAGDQDVHRAEFGTDLGERLLDGGTVTDVGRHRQRGHALGAQVFGNPLRGIGVEIEHGDLVSTASELVAGRLTHAGRTAGHHGDTARATRSHRSPALLWLVGRAWQVSTQPSATSSSSSASLFTIRALPSRCAPCTSRTNRFHTNTAPATPADRAICSSVSPLRYFAVVVRPSSSMTTSSVAATATSVAPVLAHHRQHYQVLVIDINYLLLGADVIGVQLMAGALFDHATEQITQRFLLGAG